MDFLPLPLVLAPILLLCIFFLHGRVLSLIDEVTGSFISGDVPVGVAEELLEGVWSPLECGPYEGLITGSLIEVLNHYLFDNVSDAVPHRLKLLKEQAKGLVILALYLLEIPRLH